MSALVETIRATLNSDNDTRNAAEKAFSDAKKDQPVAVAEGLVLIITNAQLEQALREQSAVLLRRALSTASNDDSFWKALGQQAQVALRSQLLTVLEAEADRKVRRKVADCVQTLGSDLVEMSPNSPPPISIAAWPELLPTLMRIISDTTKDAGIRADCIWAVRKMVMQVWTALLAGGEQTLQMFRFCFTDTSDSVAAEGAALFCGFVNFVDKKSDKAPYQVLVPELIAVVQRLAQLADVEMLDMLLQEMQEPADFFKDHVTTTIMPVIGVIAKGHSDDGARRNALELVNSLYEAKPKTVLKAPGFLEQALELIIHFILEMDDDTEAWANQAYDAEPEEEQHQCGMEAIDRLARAANSTDEGFAPVLLMLKPAVERLFASGEWKQVVTGIDVLKQVAEYIDEESTVQQLLRVVVVQLRATHPRVRYAAWSAVAQFSTDHEEAFNASEWAKALLPEFILGMEDSCSRVSIRSMEAFQHYGEEVDREDMEPFVQALMEGVGRKLQGSTVFQRMSITFIAVMAGQLEDAFAEYYPMVMPILQRIIQATLHQNEERSLLGKCFECMSLMAKAVGRDGFRNDAELFMGWMIQATQVPDLPSNDPVNEYMMAAAERICGTMKADFLPFVPHILPLILAKLSITPKDAGELDAGSRIDADSLCTITKVGEEVKLLILSTTQFEELKGALECLHTLATNLGKSFAPYISQTAQALLPVFEFSVAEEIRTLAFETWSQLLISAKEAGQSQVLNELVMELMRRVLPKLTSEEDASDVLQSRAEGIKLCLQKAGPGVLGAQEVKHISDSTLKLVGEFLTKQSEMRKAAEQDGDDQVPSDDEDDDKAVTALCEISGALMQHHPDLFVAECLQEWLRVATQLLSPGLPAEERKLALYIVCDMLEHLQDRVTPQWPQFLPQLIGDIHHNSVVLRQAACYGISWAAKNPMFAEVAPQVAAQLAEVVTLARQQTKKKSEKPVQATADNALSGLIEILRNHKTAVASNEEQLWNVWLGGLPCLEDEQEGQKNHGILFTLLQQQAPQVVGKDGQNIPSALGILVDLYSTDMVDCDTSAGIKALTLALGDATRGAYAAAWPEKRQKKFLRIVRDAQQRTLIGNV